MDDLDKFNKKSHNKVGIKGMGSMQHQRDKKTIGYSQSGDGTDTAANLENGQTISYQLIGRSPQGEKDTLRVCQILVSRLNNLGGNWNSPISVNEGVVDCETSNRNYKSFRIRFQVVRADANPKLWKSLSQHGSVGKTQNIESLVETIKLAIESKANDRKIPKISRKGITLTLDATKLPALSFDTVIEAFSSKWSVWASELGFESIWLVGPNESLTWQLDIQT
jgi:hypothetical protein